MVRAVIHRSASTKRFDKCEGESNERAGQPHPAALSRGHGRCGGVRSRPWPGRLRRWRQRWIEFLQRVRRRRQEDHTDLVGLLSEGANANAMDNQLQRYMESHPNVKIERTAIPFADLKQKLLQGATAGELPDIAVIDNPDHQAFAALGVLTDLTERVTAWGQASAYFRGRGTRRSTRARTTASPTTATASSSGTTPT